MIRTILVTLALLQASWAAHASAENQLKMKLDYAKTVVFESSSARRIEESDNTDARERLSLAQEKYRRARAAQEAQDFAQAEEFVNEALRLVTSASQMLPNTNEQAAKDKSRFNELLTQLETYSTWHQNSSLVNTHPDDDQKQIQDQTAKAKELANSGDYTKANELLSNLLGAVVMKTNSSLKDKTSTYDLNFSSPEEEYSYELARNEEFLRLIPIAIAQKQPSEGMKSLMEKFIEKSSKLRLEAERQLEQQQTEAAIESMQKSTEELSRAIKLSGVR